MTLYIIDIIGKHSGAHFYNKSFRDTLNRSYEKIRIISNYTDPYDNLPALLENYYEGNFPDKLFKLFKSLLKYYFFILKYSGNYFIFLSYGNAFEMLFVLPLIFCRKKVIDVHEVISLISKNKLQDAIRTKYAKVLYNHIADAVIIHSGRSETLLDKLDFKKLRLHIPHFSYDTDKAYSEDKISDEVHSLISRNRINILLFGYVRLSKGIDTVIRLAGKTSSMEIGGRINLIIAGKDQDSIVKSFLKTHENHQPGSLSTLLRYITDDELKYLFSKTDFVILPYKQISQSGVLEMAVHFRKPLLTSSVDYFRDFLDRFPSFGIYCSDDSVDGFAGKLEYIAYSYNEIRNTFYLEPDLKKFTDYKNPEKFLKDLATVLPVSGQY